MHQTREHNEIVHSICQNKLQHTFPVDTNFTIFFNLGNLTTFTSGADPGGGPGGPAPPPLTTKNEAPAPKFYKTEAPEWQF